MNNKDIFNSLIQDTQETSRFIESKTAIITTIIGVILIYYVQDIENILKYCSSFSFINYCFFILLIISFVFNLYILFKIIFPRDNPVLKIPKDYSKYPNLYLSKSHLNIENPNLVEFQNALSSDKNTEKAMELEYVKTSYIRNEKLYYYKILVGGVFIQVLLFIIHLLIYNSELLKLSPI